MQVVGEVDNTEMLGMTDDMGYLFNDTGLPVDDGQVQGPGGWGVRLWPSKPNHSVHPLPSKHHCPPVISLAGAC